MDHFDLGDGIPDDTRILHYWSYHDPVALLLDLTWAGADVATEKGVGIISVIRHLVYAKCPAQVGADIKAQVFSCFHRGLRNSMDGICGNGRFPFVSDPNTSLFYPH